MAAKEQGKEAPSKPSRKECANEIIIQSHIRLTAENRMCNILSVSETVNK